MMQNLSKFLPVLLLAILSACALPQAVVPVEVGIDRHDIKAVNLSREGLALYQKSRFEEAELKFRQALYLAPTAASIKVNLSAALRSQQLYDEAELLLNQVALEDPQALEAKAALAALLYEAGKHAEANALWAKLEKIYAERSDFARLAAVLQNQAAAAFADGYEAEALCFYHEKSQVTADISSNNQYVRMQIALGLYKQAFDQQLKSLDLDPALSDPEFWYLLSLTAVANENSDIAIKAFTRMAAQLSTRPDLSLKFSVLKEALLHFYSDKEVLINDVVILSAPPKSEESDSVDQESGLSADVYKNLLTTEESLYYPMVFLEYFEIAAQRVTVKE